MGFEIFFFFKKKLKDEYTKFENFLKFIELIVKVSTIQEG